ncbi:MAG: hypothetical protein QJR05_04510 [Thermoanaerobacterium sp.]|nr:hypothetical protein [Thermoanaerobacterium sp.]
MAKFDRLFDEFISLAESNTSSIWREEPVDLLTFFSSPMFLNERPYPGKQTQILKDVNDVILCKFTGDKKYCNKFGNITEMVFLLGKGSGKDFLASAIMTYMSYLLLNLRDPHEYFGFGQGEPIDLVNVAINANQANNVYFTKLKARLLNSKWFVRVNRQPESPREFQLTKKQIRFYKNITAHSAHSEAEKFEGFNPLMVIFDEIGGFDYKKAEELYSIFRSSAVSRYNDKMLLMFISYPRHEDDFMMFKYNQGENNPEIYRIRAASWEVNLGIKKESLEADYKQDPEGARQKYECIPPKQTEALIQYPERVDQVVKIGKTSQNPGLIIQETVSVKTLATGEEKYFVGLEMFNLKLNPDYVYYIGGDGGVKTDSYVISVMHAEPTAIEVVENGETIIRWINKPVEDLLLQWKPDKKERLPVDLMNVADILDIIVRQVHVKKALFDKFNSAEVVQRLMSMGVEAEDKTFSNPFQLQIYQNLKTLIYSGLIELLDIPEANEELKKIKLVNGNKIDHDKKNSKDFSDARAIAAWLVSTDEAETFQSLSIPIIAGARIKK